MISFLHKYSENRVFSLYLCVMENYNQLFSLEGKTALVTGAAYGIGFAMAEALAGA